jgi:arabinogalactan endo-1,4-beta-galactosidase
MVFDSAKANKVKYDVIGLSYYPFGLKDYTETIADLENNLKIWLRDTTSDGGWRGNDEQIENTYQMLIATKSGEKRAKQKGLGVVWEPLRQKSWSGYSLSAWQNDGKPSAALNAFKR